MRRILLFVLCAFTLSACAVAEDRPANFQKYLEGLGYTVVHAEEVPVSINASIIRAEATVEEYPLCPATLERPYHGNTNDFTLPRITSGEAVVSLAEPLASPTPDEVAEYIKSNKELFPNCA